MAQAQVQVVETQARGECDGQSETLELSVTLPNLQGIEPLTIKLLKDASIPDVNQTVNQLLKLDDDSAVKLMNPTYFETIPPAFEIKVGSTDSVDFEKGVFTISSDTRFIQYANDLLDEAKSYDDESKADQTEGEIRCDGNLKALLENNSTLRIGDARIQFQRTLRIPDDNKTYPLPPSLGQFPC